MVQVSGADLQKHEHDKFPLTCCFLHFCTFALKWCTYNTVFTCLLMLMSKKILATTWFWQQQRHVHMHPWLRSLHGSLSQECSCEQPHSNSCLCLWWIVVPMIRWPPPQLFQMTPALNWENTALSNAHWDTRGMILAVRCVNAASPCPSVDLWPALRPAPMDMCEYTQWPRGFLIPTCHPFLHLSSVFSACLKASVTVSDVTCRYMKKLYTLLLQTHKTEKSKWIVVFENSIMTVTSGQFHNVQCAAVFSSYSRENGDCPPSHFHPVTFCI